MLLVLCPDPLTKTAHPALSCESCYRLLASPASPENPPQMVGAKFLQNYHQPCCTPVCPSLWGDLQTRWMGCYRVQKTNPSSSRQRQCCSVIHPSSSLVHQAHSHILSKSCAPKSISDSASRGTKAHLAPSLCVEGERSHQYLLYGVLRAHLFPTSDISSLETVSIKKKKSTWPARKSITRHEGTDGCVSRDLGFWK